MKDKKKSNISLIVFILASLSLVVGAVSINNTLNQTSNLTPEFITSSLNETDSETGEILTETVVLSATEVRRKIFTNKERRTTS